MPSLQDLQTNLADANQRVRNLTVLGLDPSLSPEKLAIFRNLERSARAEAVLRQKALDYAQGKIDDQGNPTSSNASPPSPGGLPNT